MFFPPEDVRFHTLIPYAMVSFDLVLSTTATAYNPIPKAVEHGLAVKAPLSVHLEDVSLIADKTPVRKLLKKLGVRNRRDDEMRATIGVVRVPKPVHRAP